MARGRQTKKIPATQVAPKDAAILPPGPYIDRGEPLPRSYAENRIVALVRSPEHIHVYWDVETEVRVAGSPRVVRVHCLSEGRTYDLTPSLESDNGYLRVEPNRTYRLELLEKRGGRLRHLADSEEVTTPVRWAGEGGACAPAEVDHARRHPIARERAATGKPLPSAPERREAGSVAEAGVVPPSVVPEIQGESARQTRQAPDISGPTPALIPAPREVVFTADYVQGDK